MAKRGTSRVTDPAAREFAAKIAHEVKSRGGANTTFVQPRELAAAVAEEMLAEVAGPNAKA